MPLRISSLAVSGDSLLQVRCERRNGAVVVSVQGELDLGTVESLRAVLHSPEASAETVVIDLRRLGFIDSSGLSLLVAEQHRARDGGFHLAVAVGGAPAVRRLIELTGLSGTLTIVEDPESAGIT